MFISLKSNSQTQWFRGSQINFSGEYTYSFDSVKFVNFGGYDNGGFGTSTRPNSIIITDVDGDKKKDIILKCSYNLKDGSGDDVFFLRIFKNNNGNFSEITKSYTTEPIKVFRDNLTPAQLFDFNKDGMLDVFIAGGGFEGNAQGAALEKTYLNNPILNLKEGIDFINVGNQFSTNFIPRMQFLCSENGKLKESNRSKFDKIYFASIVSQYAEDINSDGFTDLIIEGSVFSYDTVSKKNTELSQGFGIFENIGGKYFQFKNGTITNPTRFEKQLNKPYTIFETRADLGYGIIPIDINNDGLKDLLIQGASYQRTYLQPSDTIYNAGILTERKNETRVYINNKGIFDKDNYIIPINLNINCLNLVDINNDGYEDIIGINDYEKPDDYIYSSKFQVYLNDKKMNFTNETKKYFPLDTLIKSDKFSSKNNPDYFFLIDLNGDNKKDILPVDYNGSPYRIDGKIAGDGSPFLRYGIDPKNRNTYYLSFENDRFIKKEIGIFSNWKFIDSTNYFNEKNKTYFDFVIKNYNGSNNKSIIPEDPSIMNFNYMMNVFTPSDIDGDGKIELFGFNSNYFINFSDDNFLKLPGLPKIEYPHPSIPSFILYPCKVNKVEFSTKNYTICNNDSLKLSITNINKGDTLKWFYGTKSDLSNTSSKTFLDSTKLYVTRTDSLGCTISSDTVQISKFSNPSAPIISRDTANYLISTSYNTTWYKDGAAISDTAQRIKPIAAGSYTAKTTQNGCTSTMSNPYYYLVTDIINLSADEFIKLAPNPFNSYLNFDFILKGYQRLNLEVFEITSGLKVATRQNLIAGNQINLGELSPGTYIVKVTSQDNKINYQFKMVKL